MPFSDLRILQIKKSKYYLLKILECFIRELEITNKKVIHNGEWQIMEAISKFYKC